MEAHHVGADNSSVTSEFAMWTAKILWAVKDVNPETFSYLLTRGQ
jgi:hypothetical protein